MSDNFFVTIKPGKNCVYKDIVNILDEMTINNIKRYALVDIANQEEQQIVKLLTRRSSSNFYRTMNYKAKVKVTMYSKAW